MDGEISLVEPKSKSSCRRISLSHIATEALLRRRKVALREKHGSEFVFPSSRGTVLRKSNFIRRDWAPIRNAAGIPKTRFHDLRHAAASLHLAAGVNPKVVQEMLGHASIRLTLDTYCHLIPTLQDSAADAIDRALGHRNRVA